MTNPNQAQLVASDIIESDESPNTEPACVLVFNASDPSGGAGLYGDALAMASVGAHVLPIVTGTYARDTGEIFEHFALDEEAVNAQARAVLEDIDVQVIKVGFVGSPGNLGVIAEIASDYEDIPLIAYMPNLAWWDDAQIESYWDAFEEMILPQSTVLVGNYSTLCRWLLPDWSARRGPQARDIAQAADAKGCPFTLITGIALPDHGIDNVLASPHEILNHGKHARKDAVFVGAGDTVSAALAALLASGSDLGSATDEALSYLERCLDKAFRPGMGQLVPDRLFWAQPQTISLDDAELEALQAPDVLTTDHRHVTKH